MANELLYDGKNLVWFGKTHFKATSGLPGHQSPKEQCTPDKGPVPEGNYYIPLIQGGSATDDGTGRCNLSPSWQVQTITRGVGAGVCEPYWANWGHNRVRFEPADLATTNACSPKRGGFYLHDSTKGFSHGCIEVQDTFFDKLREFMVTRKERRLNLKVKYIGKSTYGGTKVP